MVNNDFTISIGIITLGLLLWNLWISIQIVKYLDSYLFVKKSGLKQLVKQDHYIIHCGFVPHQNNFYKLRLISIAENHTDFPLVRFLLLT